EAARAVDDAADALLARLRRSRNIYHYVPPRRAPQPSLDLFVIKDHAAAAAARKSDRPRALALVEHRPRGAWLSACGTELSHKRIGVRKGLSRSRDGGELEEVAGGGAPRRLRPGGDPEEESARAARIERGPSAQQEAAIEGMAHEPGTRVGLVGRD